MALAIGMAASNLLLSCKMISIDTTQQIIVTPPIVEREFWVHGNQVSREYLEQMSLYFTDLALTYHKDNIAGQVELFLKHVDPAAHGTLANLLNADADRIRRNSLAQVFHPLSVRVREADKLVAITGELQTIVGERVASRRRATYRITFTYRNSRLYVSEFGEANEADPFAPAADPAGRPGA